MQNVSRDLHRMSSSHGAWFRLVVIHIAAALLLGVSSTAAQETDPAGAETSTVEASQESEEAIHDQLRQFRTDMESVVAKGVWEDLTPFLSSRVVVTWLDGTQSHGTDEVLEYLRSKTEGENAIVDRFTLTTEVAELSDLYGPSMAIAFGTATSSFVLRGSEVTVAGPWSATMVKEADQWKLASLTASVGVFDNPLLSWVRRMIWVVAIGVGLLGLVIGLLLGRRSRAAAG